MNQLVIPLVRARKIIVSVIRPLSTMPTTRMARLRMGSRQAYQYATPRAITTAPNSLRNSGSSGKDKSKRFMNLSVPNKVGSPHTKNVSITLTKRIFFSQVSFVCSFMVFVPPYVVCFIHLPPKKLTAKIAKDTKFFYFSLLSLCASWFKFF